jgi:adenylate cyclase
MTEQSEQEAMVEHVWRTYLTTGEFTKEARQRRFLRMLPGEPRCKNCYAPFHGIGSTIVKLLYSKGPSNMNPQMCNACDVFARTYQGGAEIELSLLFADVRGSTTLAEKMSPKEFGRLINRFYKVASHILVHSNALIDKIIGDQASGMYAPGIAGNDHAQCAIDAAQELLKQTGHMDPGGPWIPLGVGVHTGTAFVGSVGSSDGTMDITVLGDVPNTAARFSSSAREGEILISQPAATAAGLQTTTLEQRDLDLKGKSEPVPVYVLTPS